MKLLFLILSGLTVANTDKNLEKPWQNGMFKIPDMTDICESFKGATEVSDKCAEQLDVVCWNMTLFRTMYQAYPRFPFNGMDYASPDDFGNYDQCLSIEHHYNDSRLLGRYCLLSLYVPQSFENITKDTSFYRLSVCKPDACTDDDYNNIMAEVLDPKFPVFYEDHICETVKNYTGPFTTTDVVTMSLFGAIIWLMFISTAYDTCIYYNKLDHSTSKDQIEVFHGFRSVSMMWIVAGHAMMTWEMVPIVNWKKWGDGTAWSSKLSSAYILTAPLAVDTFFYMAGFLIAFHYLKCKEKPLREQITSVPFMYLHRYLRLTPALLMMYLVVTSLFLDWGDGPEWFYTKTMADTCKKYWWALFLYIQNYYNYNDVCIPQTWYLSTDTQMYLLSPLVLIPVAVALRKPSGFAKCMVHLLFLNVLFTFLPMAVNLHFRKYTNTYGIHSKLIDYFVGIMLGIFMREKIDKPFLYMFKERHRSNINLVVWIAVLFGMLSIIVIHQYLEIEGKYVTLCVFYALMRPGWCAGLSWIVYSCYHGYGGFINWILCRPTFQVLGRLSYCIYLVHQSVIDYHLYSKKLYWYFTDYNAFYFFCGHYVVSVILALFWTLAFESPMIVIAKYIFKTENKLARDETQNRTAENMNKTNLRDFIQHGTTEKLSTRDEEVYKEYSHNC